MYACDNFPSTIIGMLNACIDHKNWTGAVPPIKTRGKVKVFLERMKFEFPPTSLTTYHSKSLNRQ